MKLDILAFAAHPDDVELAASGTVIKHVNAGKKVGIVDLTRGEMGTRGTPDIRDQESDNAAKIMGLSARDNLRFRDVFFTNDEAHQLEVVRKIRQYQPEIVLANAVSDRHPDHSKASQLVTQACFMAGLSKIETDFNDQLQKAWRPHAVYHYIQSSYVSPDLVIDVSDVWDKRMESLMAYGSQFHDPKSDEPETFISSPQFLELIKSRSVDLGKTIGVQHAEGFTVERVVGVKDLFDLI